MAIILDSGHDIPGVPGVGDQAAVPAFSGCSFIMGCTAQVSNVRSDAGQRKERLKPSN
ncbi:hypothetical protein G3N28_04490 [Desulfobacter hydrogenophilus]|nr:hypothetical protein [Desulfobacter hydrogenophilus]